MARNSDTGGDGQRTGRQSDAAFGIGSSGCIKPEQGFDPANPESVIVVDGENVAQGSDAVLALGGIGSAVAMASGACRVAFEGRLKLLGKK